jgi:DNA-3-methyladenine glycosylase II
MSHPYISHLSKDTAFQKVLVNAEHRELKTNTNLAQFLYTSIINQQLSAKVGDVFLKRFLDIYNGLEPNSSQILETPDETLQAIGLSKPKVSYIKNVAQFDADFGLEYNKFIEMTDQEIIDLVTSIKGIGKWSAQNLLMFALGREDVFSADDLIIRNKMAILFNLDKTDKKKFNEDIIRLSKPWSPYRTFACLHLWRWKEF